MTGQTSYGNMSPYFAGGLHGLHHDIETFVNDTGAAKMVSDVSYSAVDSTVYSFTVNGILVSFTSGTSTTLALIRAGIIAAFRAIRELEGIASVNPSGNNVRITAARAGTAFTATNVTNTTVTAVTANVALTTIPFGSAIVQGSGAGGKQSGKLPGTPVAKVITLTVTGATNATVYNFLLFFPRTGETALVEITADGSATGAEVVTALVNKVNDMDVPVTAADGAGDTIVLTSDLIGNDFQVLEAETEITQADTTANVDNVLRGVLSRVHTNVDPVTPGEGASFGQDMSVVKRGTIAVPVDEAIAITDPVYYRYSTGGTGTGAVGSWRRSTDTDRARLVPQARWSSTTTGAGVALLDLNLP